MHGDHSRSSPADAERRLARKLHDPRLFDSFYAQTSANAAQREMLEAALALVRDHGELGYQRRDSIRRRHLNEVNMLRIAMCDGACGGNLGVASAEDEGDEGERAVACDVLVDLRLVEKDVRSWSVSTVEALAVLLVHEQEHCVRDPDDRESVAIDEERTLARKIGEARLMEYVVSSYEDLDKTGHWKR